MIAIHINHDLIRRNARKDVCLAVVLYGGWLSMVSMGAGWLVEHDNYAYNEPQLTTILTTVGVCLGVLSLRYLVELLYMYVQDKRKGRF